MAIIPFPKSDGGFNFISTGSSSESGSPEVESRNTKTPTYVKFLLGVLSLLLIGILLMMIDHVFLDNKYWNKFQYGSDCTYIVPEGYKIVYSESKKKYAVRLLDMGDHYLYNGRFGPDDMFSHIADPAYFDDSCEAKSFLKAYLKEREPRAIDFK